MQIGTRFAEYAVTGAFFWIGQLIIVSTWSYLTGVPIAHPVEVFSFFEHVPTALQASANNLVGALGILGIFLAGLLLDLFGGYFIIWEMSIFRKHLEKNHGWLKDVIEKNASYAMDDYSDFNSKFGDPWGKQEWQTGFDIFIFWNPQRRKRYTDSAKRAFGRFKLIRPYNRLWSFLSSFISVLSGSSQSDLFVDQMHLWRTSRAISTTMIIFSLEVSGMFLLLLMRWDYRSPLPPVWWFPILQIALMLTAASITRLAYSRMCVTLFSLAYMTNEKLQIENASKSQSLSSNS